MIEKKDIKYFDYPNPRFRREKYQVLDQECDFYFYDNSNDTILKKTKIQLPFSFETIKSKVNLKEMYKHIAYDIDFDLDEIGNYLLHFKAVDYKCDVKVNGQYVGSHVGGFTSFFFEISSAIVIGKNTIHIDVYDSFNKSQLRGKQREKNDSHECWYVQTTGIYNSVFIEKCGTNYIKSAKFNGDENGYCEYQIETSSSDNLDIVVSNKSNVVYKKTINGSCLYKGSFKIDNPLLWSVDSPELYDVELALNGKENDCVSTYFGFRTVKADSKKIYINNKEVYLRLILNQGYYLNQGMTLTKEDILNDFNYMIEFGFNGCRIHQKVEDPLLYYLADTFGFYLWSEVPSCYEYTQQAKDEINRDIYRIIDQNYNSPSIITYVIFNESWGIPEIEKNAEVQEYVKSLKTQVKEYDNTRLVVANDGWNNLTNTDILSLHEYNQDPKLMYEEYKDFNKVINENIINCYGKAFANNQGYQNQPLILSEFGGIAVKNSNGWGYGDKASGIDELKIRMVNLFKTINKLKYFSGFCYTQLTDVQQETNGLLTEDRKVKLDPRIIKTIVKGGEINE